MRSGPLSLEYPRYDSLTTSVVPTLSADLDKKVFTTACSIAKNSTQYWKTDQAKWDSIARNHVLLKVNPGKDIIYADVAGGIAGLVRGAVVGAAGGTVAVPGVSTVTGAAAGGIVGGAVGGVTASAVEGIHTFVKWLINW